MNGIYNWLRSSYGRLIGKSGWTKDTNVTSLEECPHIDQIHVYLLSYNMIRSGCWQKKEDRDKGEGKVRSSNRILGNPFILPR